MINLVITCFPYGDPALDDLHRQMGLLVLWIGVSTMRSYWVSEANYDSIQVAFDIEKTMDVKAIQLNSLKKNLHLTNKIP